MAGAGTPPTLKARALRLLAQKEYTAAELNNKLVEYAVDAAELTKLIAWLQEMGFLSDERALQSFLNQKAARYGSAKLLQQLKGKGFADELLEQAKQQLTSSEFERARMVWRKKFSSAPVDRAQELKQMRFLAYRGFSSEVIFRLLEQVKEELRQDE